jgi:signal transduction histidine kinase
LAPAGRHKENLPDGTCPTSGSMVPARKFQRLQSLQENAICRIVQEGLRNARKHSHSPSVRIELRQQGDRIRLVVQDWGIGFDPGEIGEYHFGLDAIRERARLLGGLAQIESRLGDGTCITVEMPLQAREDDE